MSVIIKNMKFPNNCNECQMAEKINFINIEGISYVCRCFFADCYEEVITNYKETRHPKCPLEYIKN